MRLHTPFNFVYRSSVSSPCRRYGPFVNLSRTIVKLLFLVLVRLTLSVLLFAVFNQDSSVAVLGRIGDERWNPLVALILPTIMLAAIEESMP